MLKVQFDEIEFTQSNMEALCFKENFYVWLSEVWLRFEGILTSRGKTVIFVM